MHEMMRRHTPAQERTPDAVLWRCRALYNACRTQAGGIGKYGGQLRPEAACYGRQVVLADRTSRRRNPPAPCRRVLERDPNTASTRGSPPVVRRRAYTPVEQLAPAVA